MKDKFTIIELDVGQVPEFPCDWVFSAKSKSVCFVDNKKKIKTTKEFSIIVPLFSASEDELNKLKNDLIKVAKTRHSKKYDNYLHIKRGNQHGLVIFPYRKLGI